MALRKGKIQAKSIVSTAASVAATAMVVRSLIPHDLTQHLLARFQNFLTTFSNNVTIIINEFDGLNKNKLFSAAELYMGTIAAPSAMTLRATLPEKEKKIHVSIGKDEDVADTFRGARLIWRLVTATATAQQPGHRTTVSEVRSLHLTFHKRHRRQVIDEYLPYVVEKSKGLSEENKVLKLHTLGSEDGYFEPGTSPWRSVNLDHPSTFQTLALDDEVKSMIIDDLERFVKRNELYKKVGKAWKRGYLLFGPPGTGKSSLIAAMANYLKFDIYDLELTALRQNSSLRQLLIATANRSILVVEDIDATIDLSERKKAATSAIPHHPSYNTKPMVTLSGLLNFIDGLWTSCGDERIIIFTTNHKEKLDPALLRPGRMDLHIHMSYCTPCGFKLLAKNYLGIEEEHHHPLVTEAELLVGSTKVTPAEVGEQLLKSDDPEMAIKGLIVFLEGKKKKKKKSKKVLEENLEATIDIGVEGPKEVSTTEI